jgi:hypothetical protein
MVGRIGWARGKAKADPEAEEEAEAEAVPRCRIRAGRDKSVRVNEVHALDMYELSWTTNKWVSLGSCVMKGEGVSRRSTLMIFIHGLSAEWRMLK